MRNVFFRRLQALCLAGMFAACLPLAAGAAESLPVSAPTPQTAGTVETPPASELTTQIAGAAEKTPQAAPKNRVPGPSVTDMAWPGGTLLSPGKWFFANQLGYGHGSMRKGGHSQTNHNSKGQAVGPDGNNRITDSLKIRYGINDNWDIRMTVPYINNDIDHHSPEHDSWAGGVNDMNVVLRRKVVGLAPGQPFAVSFDVGASLPTGEVGENNVGTGAWGVLIGGGASWIADNQRVDLDARYGGYTEGAHDTTPANYFQSDFNYAYAATDWIDLGAETNVRVSGASKEDGEGQDDGYTEWYGGPKVEFHIPDWDNMSIGTAVLFPIYRQYDNPGGQLSDDVRIESMVSVIF